MKRKIVDVFLLFVLPFVVMGLSVQQSFAASPSKTCEQESLQVNLSASDPTGYTIVGWLCYTGTMHGKTVEVLVPGATYDHNYWDFPYNNGQYSYVDSAISAGFVTFNIDRLGTGLSSHPAPELLTVQSQAYPLHQIIQDLRSGQIGGNDFSKIILIGHSLGSEIAAQEASTYNDEDGLVITGLLHTFNLNANTLFDTDIYPASSDPAFNGQNLASGYLTSVPGTRGALFYNTSFADPNVISMDEQLKSTVTDGELSSFASILFTNTTDQIKVPVLIVMGQDDLLFCEGTSTANCSTSTSLLNSESGYYTSAKSLSAFVLPLSGHDVNLHYDSQAWFGYSIGWAYSHVVF